MRANDDERIGRHSAAQGFIAVAAKKDFDGGIGVVPFTSEGFEHMLGEFHRNIRLGQRQRVGNHPGHHQRDVGAETLGQGPGGCERRGCLGKVGKDDLEVELAFSIRKIWFCPERSILKTNRFHQFQARETGIKAVFIFGSAVSGKC
jgi:hypothetical protein